MNAWKRTYQAWEHWFFRYGDLRALAMFRIGWALALLMAADYERGLFKLYSSDQYHVPLLAFAVPLSQHAFQNLLRVAELGCVMTLIGLVPRLGALLVIATLGYLFASDLLLFRNHVYFGLLTGSLLLVSPCDRVWSVAAWWRNRRGRPRAATGSLASAQLIKAQVLIVYGFAALNKLRPSFLDGFTLEKELPLALKASPLHALLCDPSGALRPEVERVLHDGGLMAAAAVAVCASEACLCLGLMLHRWRRHAVLLGLVLHAGIYLFMNIRAFSLLMVATYPLFLQRAWFEAASDGAASYAGHPR